MRRAPISELCGGDPAADAAILEGILAGNIRSAKLRPESFDITAVEIAQQSNGQVVTIYTSSGGHHQ